MLYLIDGTPTREDYMISGHQFHLKLQERRVLGHYWLQGHRASKDERYKLITLDLACGQGWTLELQEAIFFHQLMLAIFSKKKKTFNCGYLWSWTLIIPNSIIYYSNNFFICHIFNYFQYLSYCKNVWVKQNVIRWVIR